MYCGPQVNDMFLTIDIYYIATMNYVPLWYL